MTVRDIDRGFSKLMKRLGAKAKKARRGANKGGRAAKRSIRKLFKDAAKEIKRIQKDKPTEKQLAASVVTVGIHAAEGGASHAAEGEESSTATVADVASYHEFGLGVPQRSFIRGWADENEKVNKQRLSDIAKAVMSARISSPRMGLTRFGLLAVAEIQQRMAEGIPPALDEATVKAKGSSTPLIDTGQLRSSITAVVSRKGKSGGDSE